MHQWRQRTNFTAPGCTCSTLPSTAVTPFFVFMYCTGARAVGQVLIPKPQTAGQLHCWLVCKTQVFAGNTPLYFTLFVRVDMRLILICRPRTKTNLHLYIQRFLCWLFLFFFLFEGLVRGKQTTSLLDFRLLLHPGENWNWRRSEKIFKAEKKKNLWAVHWSNFPCLCRLSWQVPCRTTLVNTPYL